MTSKTLPKTTAGCFGWRWPFRFWSWSCWHAVNFTKNIQSITCLSGHSPCRPSCFWWSSPPSTRLRSFSWLWSSWPVRICWWPSVWCRTNSSWPSTPGFLSVHLALAFRSVFWCFCGTTPGIIFSMPESEGPVSLWSVGNFFAIKLSSKLIRPIFATSFSWSTPKWLWVEATRTTSWKMTTCLQPWPCTRTSSIFSSTFCNCWTRPRTKFATLGVSFSKFVHSWLKCVQEERKRSNYFCNLFEFPTLAMVKAQYSRQNKLLSISQSINKNNLKISETII